MGAARWFTENLLLIMTVCGVFLGVLVGCAARLTDYTPDTVMLISFPGEIMMRMLKMMILPLIISSIISGLGNLDTTSSGKMGYITLVYYFTTTMLAVVLGIILVTTIHPGNPDALGERPEIGDTGIDSNVVDALLDIIRNMFPDNLIKACFVSVKTIHVPVEEESNTTNTNINETINSQTKYKRKVVDGGGTNVVGLIIFSVVFGGIMSRMPNAKTMNDFFNILNDIIMKMVGIVIWYSPFGLMCLIIGQIMSIANLTETIQMLGMYMVTVVVGLAIHALVTLPFIYFFITRKNPVTFTRGMLQALITALGTASSTATLPVTFRCLEDNNKIDKRVTRFILPVGATINMDGTALYEAVAAIFIAQLYGYELGIGQLITVSLTATLASIGATTVPSAGLVTMMLVMTSIGLPADYVTLVFGVDWLLDRLRTSINLLGDAYGAAIVAHLCRNELENSLPAGSETNGHESQVMESDLTNKLDCFVEKL